MKFQGWKQAGGGGLMCNVERGRKAQQVGCTGDGLGGGEPQSHP